MDRLGGRRGDTADAHGSFQPIDPRGQIGDLLGDLLFVTPRLAGVHCRSMYITRDGYSSGIRRCCCGRTCIRLTGKRYTPASEGVI